MVVANSENVVQILKEAESKPLEIGALNFILAKARKLKVISGDEIAHLLTVRDPEQLRKIYTAAADVKEQMFDRSVTMMPVIIVDGPAGAGVPDVEGAVDLARDVSEKGTNRLLLYFKDASAMMSDSPKYIDAIIQRLGRRSILLAAPPVDGEFGAIPKDLSMRLFVLESGHYKTPDLFAEVFKNAIEAGIKDIGVYVRLEKGSFREGLLSTALIAQHFAEEFGQGFRTMSFCLGGEGPDLTLEECKQAIAVLRLSVPYVNIAFCYQSEHIIELLDAGASEVSFETTEDLQASLKELINAHHIPSCCRVCSARGRSGAIYQQHLLSGAMREKCFVNSIVTAGELAVAEFEGALRDSLIEELHKIIDEHEKPDSSKRARDMLERVKAGEKGLYWDDIEWQLNIKIIVNGEMRFFHKGVTLQYVLEDLGLKHSKVKLNDDVVEKEDFPNLELKWNDCIEITANL